MVYVREGWKIGKGRRTSEGNIRTELYPHTQLRNLRGEGCEASYRLPASPKISVAQEWQCQGAKKGGCLHRVHRLPKTRGLHRSLELQHPRP